MFFENWNIVEIDVKIIFCVYYAARDKNILFFFLLISQISFTNLASQLDNIYLFKYV